MREVWYKYVVNHPEYWTNGMTVKRLEKVKNAVFTDTNIMYDLLNRHNARKETPLVMKKFDKEQFDHCIGNFVTNIHYKMMDLGIIKG